MRNLLLVVMLIVASQSAYSQLSKKDSTTMAKVIRDFRKSDNTACQVLSVTFRYSFCPFCIQLCLDSLGSRVPDDILKEFDEKFGALTEQKTPAFSGATLVDRFSPKYQRLSGNFVTSDAATKEEIKKMKERIAAEHGEMKASILADQLNILELSQPVYDKDNKYCAVILSRRRPGWWDIYVMLYTRRSGSWTLKERIFVSREAF